MDYIHCTVTNVKDITKVVLETDALRYLGVLIPLKLLEFKTRTYLSSVMNLCFSFVRHEGATHIRKFVVLDGWGFLSTWR